jgi:peptidoglycan-associated lipoprotein
VSYGVDGGRLRTVSFGENKPMALGHDEASWAQNRRAHFVME